MSHHRKVVIGKVQDSVPVSPSRRRKAYSKYPFKEMNVGSCFDVTNPKINLEVNDNHHRLAQTLRASARRYGRMTGKKFIVRMTDEGVRVWRIE